MVVSIRQSSVAVILATPVNTKEFTTEKCHTLVQLTVIA